MKRQLPVIAVALAALGIAAAYASVTMRLGGRLALPVDDAYRYLAPSADSPSAAWSALLALPRSLVGGHALVSAAFWIGAALYAVAAASSFVVARRLGGALAGGVAAVALLAIAPLAWASLAGREVALVTACWLGALALFGRRREHDTPGVVLAAVLVVLGLARHDALVPAIAIAGAGAWQTTTWRGLAAWLAPVLPAIAWTALASSRSEPPLELDALRGAGAPLAYAFAALWLVGLVRLWRRGPLAGLVAVTPIAYLLAGGLAPGFAACAIVVGCAAAPVEPWPRARIVGAGLAALALAALAIAPLRASIVQFAQDAADLDRRVAPFVARFAEATAIGAHDPGAVAFYSGLPTIGLDGPDPLEGPGARFERLERLAPERRPSHFVSSAAAFGSGELFGEVRAVGRTGGKLAERAWSRGEVQWIEADWDHAQTAERPLTPHPGWRVVDRLDVADLADEEAHAWHGQLAGKQATLLHRETTGELRIDGGRTVIGERFALELDPGKPARLILRTGGAPDREPGATLTIAGRSLSLPAPRGALVELELELPAGTREVLVTADRPYRVFHWFVLQRD